MFNHFYSLLRNKRSEAKDPFLISKDFSELILTPALKNVDGLLFPSAGADSYLNILSQIYINTIYATPYATDILSRYDSRYYYNIDTSSESFQFFQQIIDGQTERYTLHMYGEYITDIENNNLGDTIYITSQTGNQVTVRSGTGKFSTFNEVLVFSNGISTNVKVADTGLSFSIEIKNGTFDSELPKFEVYVENALNLDTYHKLLDIKSQRGIWLAMFDEPAATVEDQSFYLYQQHPNLLYNITGLLTAYVDRLQYLYLNTK